MNQKQNPLRLQTRPNQTQAEPTASNQTKQLETKTNKTNPNKTEAEPRATVFHQTKQNQTKPTKQNQTKPNRDRTHKSSKGSNQTKPGKPHESTTDEGFKVEEAEADPALVRMWASQNHTTPIRNRGDANPQGKVNDKWLFYGYFG